ncbi:MAG: glycosyltransferase N-terminal domain-containing protein, partial [Verrucomicrobiota bacterium]
MSTALTLQWFYARISSALEWVCAPGLLLCFGSERRGRHGKAFTERLGPKTGRRFWIHAVSVGEVDVALCLIEALHKGDPRVEFILTTVTREGRRLAERCARPNVHVSHAPLDFVGAVRRSFRTFDPDLLVLVEIEIWPNQLREARRLGVPVAVVNGRLPENDLEKYRRVSWFMRDIFGLLSLVCAQSREDAEAFREMGAATIQVTGSMKMDAALEKAERLPEGGSAIWDAIAQRTVVVAGSTHPGEEEILFEMVDRMQFAGFLLVVAPRNISRAEQVMNAASQKGVRAIRW